jgi:hypothetical protein
MAEPAHPEVPHDLAHAMQLLRGAHEMYQEILHASLDHAGRDARYSRLPETP